ncbi:MAG: hypothetical protein A2133_05160 [Actinobacteria bacterium RBG_16_64_13]|nr:MAG: hypothetical protein A2133_05160 [Actinobacteria bacterium RBG_16_64_13]
MGLASAVAVQQRTTLTAFAHREAGYAVVMGWALSLPAPGSYPSRVAPPFQCIEHFPNRCFISWNLLVDGHRVRSLPPGVTNLLSRAAFLEFK